MIDRTALLDDLKRTTAALVEDLRTRTDDAPEVTASVRRQYDEARNAGRTDRSYEEWREDLLAQVAVGWVLGTVFVRFCEDNGLHPTPLLSGPGPRRNLARDHRADWLAHNPAEGDRGWLLEVFGRYRELPAISGVFGEHNPLWQFGPSDDGAKALLEVWWEVDVESGELLRDFTDPTLDTRFLGDLYQDLSEHAKKNFALLQTPEFVEEFILDRTLDPAIETFGLDALKLIDPTCGSGHFLLGAFARLFARWQDREPVTPARKLAQKALDAIHGVDLNPFAVAIARFRLLVAALKAAGDTKLSNAPDFRMNLAVGDSLLHGRRDGELFAGTEGLDPVLEHRYPTEDEEEANRILESGRYHAVVGNPPYITVKEPALRNVYRKLYDTAYRQYSLAVPFTERFFDLAQPGAQNGEAGFVGMITANSFMKRQFGKKLIEEYLHRKDLTHIIDTSGAYIPGHGTPTVILFARNRRPQSETIRAVLGIRGEPGRPEDPAKGKVWTSILVFVDASGEENAYLSSDDAPKERFLEHPWSLQGGAAPDALQQLQDQVDRRLGELVLAVGRTTHTGEDDVFLLPPSAMRTRGWDSFSQRLVEGTQVRDFRIAPGEEALFPYSQDGESARRLSSFSANLRQHFWSLRRVLQSRLNYGKTNEERGLTWWEYSMFFAERFRTPLSITFAFVATHNHFVLDRGGRVFKQTAPVIKLPAEADEQHHLQLLGLLNSSTACFWMKQVFQSKGGSGEAWEDRYEHDGTKLQQFPIPAHTPLTRAKQLDGLAQQLADHLPATVLDREPPSREALETARAEVDRLRARMVALQEELDWECYHLYGLTDRNLALSGEQVPDLARGERAFEIALARAVKAGKTTSTWFKRHGSTPITELPRSWPSAYREAVEHRLELIRTDRKLRLLERPEYKRRWNWADWDQMQKEALRDWLLTRLENLDCWSEPELQTVGRLADQLRTDPHALEAAHLYAGRSDVDLAELVGALVGDEAVPFVALYRFKPSGLRKRLEWERVWKLQRIEDEIEARTQLPPEEPRHLTTSEAEGERTDQGVDSIPVPPQYKKADFRSGTTYALRGKLDVPKERFISYPDTRIGADPTAVVGWAGWDDLEKARALAGHYQRRKDEGAEPPELLPLLMGLDELVPWLLQWHNELHPEWGERMGEFFRAFVDTEVRSLGLTPGDLRPWNP